MTAEVRCVRVLVRGLVQGVFFRDSTRRQAERLGVNGWVRNRADGRVEVHLEGAPDAVEAMVAWCGRGPTSAVVTEVVSSEVRCEACTGFEIRH